MEFEDLIDLKKACLRCGRAIHAEANGTLYCGLHLNLYRSKDDGRSWELAWSLPRILKHRLIERSRLACRLFRHEVRALRVLSDGTAVVATRRGLFYAPPGEKRMQPAVVHDEGRSFAWPMTISDLPGDQVVWGEYFGNTERREISLFLSTDRGRSYHRSYTFAPNTVKHIHNIYGDPTLGWHWVLTGDYGDEPGFALISPDFTQLEWVARGEQKFRAVSIFDFGDHLVYGTDTDREPNGVYRLRKSDGRVEKLADLDGSSIYACRCGGYYVVSTSAEPSEVNTAFRASIYVSCDGEQWRRIFSRSKDRWSFKYFQFGSLVLPRGDNGRSVLMFSGQAVKKVDGKAYVISLDTDGIDLA